MRELNVRKEGGSRGNVNDQSARKCEREGGSEFENPPKSVRSHFNGLLSLKIVMVLSCYLLGQFITI